MAPENSKILIRSLKGAPASVLWALTFTRQPMTNRELQDWTGYSDKSIAAAARRLVELGWITAFSRFGPWSVAAGRQVVSMGASASSDMAPDYPGISDTHLPISADPFGISNAGFGIFAHLHGILGDSAGISASSSGSGVSLDSYNLNHEKLLLEQEKADIPENPSRFAENLHTLFEAGIREPAAGRLANLPHVTPDYIRDHIEQVRQEGKELGAAIYRMRSGWFAPPRARTRSDEIAEKIRRFKEGV